MRAIVMAIAPVLALVLGLAQAAPAAAEAGFSLRFGSGGGAHSASGGDGGSWGTRGSGPRLERHDWRHRKDKGDDVRRHDRRHGDKAHKFGRHHRFGGRFPGFWYYRDDRYYADEREAAPAEPVAPAPPPVAEAPPEPAPPPDPRGPLRLAPARGAAPEAVAWREGAALPPGLPHVTLDWRSYGLPEPPPGRLYARVGRDVLLITAGARVVEGVLPPG